jgi:hypothetical protein
MTLTRCFVFVATALAYGSVSGQSGSPTSPGNAVVNKCTAADGSVTFSDKPCPESSKVQKVDTSAALRTGSGGHNAAMASTVADADCRRSASQSASGTVDADIAESNRHIADYQQRQKTLASQKAYAADGSGNLVDDPEARKSIAELDGLIAKERDFQGKALANVASKQEAAIKACDQAPRNTQAPPEKK